MVSIYLFDIDGVLTNPQERKVSQELLLKLSNLINSSQPVAFVTGRSLTWTKAKVIDQLNIKKPQNVFISSEKGGAWSHSNGQQWTSDVDLTLAPPETLVAKVTRLVEEKFGDTMFLDPKYTMISIEIKDGVPLQEFHKEQKELDKFLQDYLRYDDLHNEFKIDSAIISTDVENKLSGKRLGTLRVFDWLQKQNLRPAQFFAFGDTHGDTNIARTIFEKGYKVKFVFTGKKSLLPKEKLPFRTTIYDGQYEKGTLEYLNQLPA